MAASAGAPSLPATTPQALIAAVQGSTVRALSGTISETANLGLPSLPGAGSAASLSWQTFVTGTHTATIAVDGPTKQRLAVLGQLSESDVVHNGADLWTYSSDTRAVTHSTLRSPDSADDPTSTEMNAASPMGAAVDLLKAVDPTTGVTIGGTTSVAGRDAYLLVLTPKQAGTTVRRVVIAIDATRYVPLRVQVFGASSTAAFETGFTQVSFTTPEASTFDFTPPAGTVVNAPAAVGGRSRGTAPAVADPTAEPVVSGAGWTSVVELTGGLDQLTSTGTTRHGKTTGSMLDELSTVQPDGSRLIQTSLLNVLVTTDGRVLAGAVTPAVLERDAQTSA